MTYSFSRITVRPKLDVPFYGFPSPTIENPNMRYKPEIEDYINKTYVIPGWYISKTDFISSDGLIHHRRNIWLAEEIWMMMNNDEMLIVTWDERNDYNIAHGITSELAYINTPVPEVLI